MQRNRIRKHLLIFSMAAPIMALLTYTGLSQVSEKFFTYLKALKLCLSFNSLLTKGSPPRPVKSPDFSGQSLLAG